MTSELLNVLYVQSQGAFLHLEHQTVRVEVEGVTQRLGLLWDGGKTPDLTLEASADWIVVTGQ